MRSLSLTARTAIFNQQTSEAFLLLLEMGHEDFDDPIRVVNQKLDVTSNGDVYTAFPFRISLPNEDEQISKAHLVIDNVSREIIDEIRTIDTGLTAVLTVVLLSDPDTIEVGPFNLTLTNVIYNAMVIRGELNYENVLRQTYPKEDFNPINHPGLF